MHPLETRLSARAQMANLPLDPTLRTSLLAYYDLLFRWNATINLTALTDPDEAIDRLLLEPVAAARELPPGGSLMDLGSGGGSPAIPLALALDVQSPFVMVESKGRKAAFLREAARSLGLNATVESARFETLRDDRRYQGTFDVVSMRAVRMDEEALGCAVEFITPGGFLALFVSSGTTIPLPPRMSLTRRVPLLPGSELLLASRDVPRETSPV